MSVNKSKTSSKNTRTNSSLAVSTNSSSLRSTRQSQYSQSKSKTTDSKNNTTTSTPRRQNQSQYAGVPGSPIASAKKKKVYDTEPSQVSRTSNVKDSTNTASIDGKNRHRRRGSVTCIDYNDPNNNIFSPGQYHEHDHDDSSDFAPSSNIPLKVEVKKVVVPPSTVTASQQAEEDDECDFDPFLFIKQLPTLASVIGKGPRITCIPCKSPHSPPISLALDLDETLVHCSIEPIDNPELTFSVSFSGVDYDIYARIRPYLKEFLTEVSQWFEIIVFTASQQAYADRLLDILDPGRKFIKHRVFRESCVYVEGNYLKDLTVLGRQMNKIAIIDNSVQAFGFQLDNGIPIESWYDNEKDTELLNLLPFLKQLKNQTDVRCMIRDAFGLSEYVKNLPDYE